jgi:hypothetical protein
MSAEYTYRWRDGFAAHGTTAAAAHDEMERIRADGPLTAPALFEASRPEDAVLHIEFEWDGAAAVEELGLLRARGLLRAVVVSVVVPEQRPTVAHHVYVHVPPESGKRSEVGTYQPLDVVVQTPDAYARAYGELTRRFEAAEAALRELKVAAATLDGDKAAAIAVALEAFATARQALAVLAA